MKNFFDSYGKLFENADYSTFVLVEANERNF